MKILDRYIIRRFLTATFLWFVVFMSLRIVIDLSLNMDEFLDRTGRTIPVSNPMSFKADMQRLFFDRIPPELRMPAVQMFFPRHDNMDEIDAAFDEHAPDGVDLCLAGHTHGGQVRIPGYGPIVTLSGLPRHMARGLNDWGKTRIHVSAGIGSEHIAGLPPIRIFCPPEMTLIVIVPEPEPE